MASPAESWDFAMGFLSNSKRYKDQFIERWREVLANFIVDPQDYAGVSIDEPYIKGRNRKVYRTQGIILKDAETHKAIMTFASKLVLGVLGDRKGEYIQASPSGWEDAPNKAPTVTRLLRYNLGMQGQFRSLVEAVVEMLLFGTGVVEINQQFRMRERLVRSVSSIDGIVEDSFSRSLVESINDPTVRVVDVQNFFPDPGHYRIEEMSGCAKKFKMNALEAREKVRQGLWRSAATEKAIAMLGSPASHGGAGDRSGEMFRENVDQPEYRDEHGDFIPMIGFEYWGDVPWEDDIGSSRRVITILNNEVVRDVPWPLADDDFPFRSLVINPVVGRFYGISPAEVIRWDQSLQDAIKILLAEAIIRQVHPPMIVDADAEVDLARLRRFSPDVPVLARGGPNSVSTLQYNANVFSGFNEAQLLKTSMQEASGALGSIQGEPMGTKRVSATEASFVGQQAMNRPELAAAMLERDAMPLIAKSILRRYQQFLEDDEELRMRVGDLPAPIWVGDIMGDFDIQFVGSRMAMSRQEKLQSYDRLVAMTAAIPQAASLVPWQDLLASIIGDTMELPEVAARIAQPDVVESNLLLNQLAQAGQGAGNGNQTTRQPEPAGLIPAQATGAQIA